jgi:C_GCAxxG_C_C family probable redox protein
LDEKAEELIRLVRSRAQDLYETRQLHCSEAVFSVLNSAFGGGLSQEMAIRVASAFPDGLGGSGCLCGALSGGALSLGLYLGRRSPGARDLRKALPAAKELNMRFKARFRSACCSTLCEENKKGCANLTGTAAQLAAEIILKRRPELMEAVDWAYLRNRDSRIRANLKRVSNLLRR